MSQTGGVEEKRKQKVMAYLAMIRDSAFDDNERWKSASAIAGAIGMKTPLVRQILDEEYANNGWLVVLDGDRTFWGDNGASRRYRLLTFEEKFPSECDDDSEDDWLSDS